MSLGTSLAADRALGAQNNTAIENIRYGVQFANATGVTLNSFTLGYTGEQWRVITLEAADRLTFEYQVFAAGTGNLAAASGWTNVANLDFTAPIAGGSSRGAPALAGR